MDPRSHKIKGIEDQKQITILQNRVRDLNKEEGECRSQLYQLQLRHTQRIVQETATSIEVDKGNKIVPQQYRDDVVPSTSKEQIQTPPTTLTQGSNDVIEFVDDDNVEQTTAVAPQDVKEATTVSVPNDQEVLADENNDDVEILTTIQDEVSTTPIPKVDAVTFIATPTTNTGPSSTNSTTTTTPIPPVPEPEPESSAEVYEAVLPFDNLADHHGLHFDHSSGPFITTDSENDDDSDEFSIVIGSPDPSDFISNPAEFYDSLSRSHYAHDQWQDRMPYFYGSSHSHNVRGDRKNL